VFNQKSKGYVEYELTFEVLGDQPPDNCKFIDPAAVIPITLNSKLAGAAAAFEAAAKAIPSTMPLNLFEELNASIGAVASAISAVTKFVEGILTSAENVGRLYERGLGLIKNANTAIVVMRRRVGVLALNTGTAKVKGSNAISTSKRIINGFHIYNVIHMPSRTIVSTTDALKAAQAAATEKYLKNEATKASARNQKGAESIESILNSMRASFEALSKTIPQARYKVKDGDNLQVIANKYYGDAEAWNIIYKHNKLQTTELEVGTVREIPKQ